MSNSFHDSLSALCSDEPVSGLHPVVRPSELHIAVRLPDAGIDLRNEIEAFENHLILQALERTAWNKKQAAALLGLNRTTLVEMLKRKRISRAA